MDSTAVDQTAGGGPWRKAIVDLLDRLAATPWGSAAAIFVVALCCFLPGIATIPVMDRLEPVYAEAARQLVEGGSLLPSTAGQSGGFLPPGTVWLQALSVLATGADPHTIWAYRLPSLAGGLAAVLLTLWMALAFGRPRAALLAGLFMAANLVLGAEARLARPDAVLLALIVLGQGALVRIWQTPANIPARTWLVPVFWVALGAGVLVAGPVALAVPVLTILVLSIERRGFAWLLRLRPVWGLPLAIAIAAPALFMLVAGSGEATQGIAAADVQIRPEAPPGSYTLLFFAIFWPGASFFVLAVPWLLDRIRHPAIYFCIAWGLPYWVLAELYPEKLPQYVLPVLPAVALLAGIAVDRGKVLVTGGVSWFFSLGPSLLTVGIMLGAPVVVILAGGDFPYAAMPALTVGAVLGVVAWIWLRNGTALAGAGLAVIAATFTYLGLYAFLMPNLEPINLSARLIATAENANMCADPAFAASGYAEPSLRFLARNDVTFLGGAEAADYLARPGCRFAIVENRQLLSFRQRAEDIGLALTNYGRVSGVNLGAGRRTTVQVFGRGGTP